MLQHLEPSHVCDVSYRSKIKAFCIAQMQQATSIVLAPVACNTSWQLLSFRLCLCKSKPFAAILPGAHLCCWQYVLTCGTSWLLVAAPGFEGQEAGLPDRQPPVCRCCSP